MAVQVFVVESEFNYIRGGWAEEAACFIYGHRGAAEMVACVVQNSRWHARARPEGLNMVADLAQDFRAIDVLEAPDNWAGARFDDVVVDTRPGAYRRLASCGYRLDDLSFAAAAKVRRLSTKRARRLV